MSFMDYLASLPALKLDRLYESHWTCQAVLRSLPPVAKQYVLRLLLVEAALPLEELQSWARPEALSKHRAAVERLEQLRVLVQDKSQNLRLNPELQRQLRRALSSGGGPPRQHGLPGGSLRLPTPAELEQYATNQWEAVLLQLVGLATSANKGGVASSSPHPLIQDVFKRAGLLTVGQFHSVAITRAGCQYLLMDTNTQLWELIREYVSAAEERGVDSGELISFLLELGFHGIGQAYSVATLTPLQQHVVDELALLGLLQLHKVARERWFIPTRLAANLSASLSESSTWQASEGFIVVETNYRVYAYTTSRLQRAILRLILRVEYQLPNLVVGALTRESCNSALASGISAQQMIEFLRKHAHPSVAQRRPVLPETVSDQIRLWEGERNRVGLSPAVLYDDFPSKEVYEAVEARARDVGALLWSEAASCRLAVASHVHEELRNFIRQHSSGPPPASQKGRLGR